jgi:hypothetical protein
MKVSALGPETWMHTLLDRTSFPSPASGVDAFRGPFVGRSTFDGCIVFSSWPREDVEALLPEALELPASTSATPDRHPVVFLFGDQREGATRFAGLTFPTDIAYQEFVLAVPFVRGAGGQHLHTYVPRMVSSHRPATVAGNLYYGFGKRMGRMWWEGPLFLMTDADGKLQLHAQVEATGGFTSCAGDAPTCLDGVRAAFSLPILGRKDDGAFITSYFDWDFCRARVRPVDAAVSIDLPFAEGVAPGLHHAVSPGSLEVRGMRWQLSWPAPCRF